MRTVTGRSAEFPSSEVGLAELLVGSQVTIEVAVARARGPSIGQKIEFDDLVQDANLHIWGNRHKYDPKQGCFAAWASRCAYNRAITKLRGQPPPCVRIPDGLGPADAADEDEPMDLDRLRGCLARLPEAERQLVMSWYSLDAAGKREFAAALGMTYNACAIRIHHIRKQLVRYTRGE